jgi:hypothetical protein
MRSIGSTTERRLFLVTALATRQKKLADLGERGVVVVAFAAVVSIARLLFG